MKYILLLIAFISFSLKSVGDSYSHFNVLNSLVWINCDYKMVMLVDSYSSSVKFKKKDVVEGSDSNNDCDVEYDFDKNDFGQETRYSFGKIIDRGLYDSKSAAEIDRIAIDFVPMKDNLLNGGWALTEDIVRCAHGGGKIRIMAGSIWDVDSDKSLEKSHGIIVPSYFWKVVEKEDGVIAWLFPNSENATRRRATKYLISVRDLEKKINTEIPIAEWKKKIEPLANWDVSESCIKKPQGPQAAPQG